MNVLLTGATGFLGSEIARRLVAAGHDVRVLVRKTSKLDGIAGLPIERAEGDILDRASVERALAGRDAVIHTAANVSFRPRDRESIYRANVEGTRTVLEAALAAKVKRAVYTSSIAAIGAVAEPRLLDESAPWDLDKTGSHYVISKRRAEEVALEIHRRGLPVVILNPGSILGPGDLQVGSTRLLIEMLRGRAPFFVAGGTSFCDVREVAAAHVRALEDGVPGERYILAGPNFTYAELFEIAARLAGARGPSRIPYALAWLVAAGSEALARVRPHGLEEMSLPLIRMARLYGYTDVRKAQKALGYIVRPVEETVRDTIADHARRGVLEPKTPELRALAEAAAPAPARAPEAAILAECASTT